MLGRKLDLVLLEHGEIQSSGTQRTAEDLAKSFPHSRFLSPKNAARAQRGRPLSVDVDITPDTCFPSAFVFDEVARLPPDARPMLALIQETFNLVRESDGVAGRKQVTRLAIAHQFAMAAYIRGQHKPSLRHRFEWLERGHELRDTDSKARIDHHVDDAVIALHLIMGNASCEDHPIFEAICGNLFA